MAWFKTKEEENNEAYARGVERGQNADILSDFVHRVAELIPVPTSERQHELNDIEKSGYTFGRDHPAT